MKPITKSEQLLVITTTAIIKRKRGNIFKKFLFEKVKNRKKEMKRI